MDSTTRNLTQTITDLAAPLAASLGLAIWGVEVVPAGRCIIRVFAESLDAFSENRPIMTDDDARSNLESCDGSKDSDRSGASPSPKSPDLTIPLKKSEREQHSDAGHDGAAFCSDETGRNETGLNAAGQDEVGQDAMSQDEMGQGGISIDQCAELSRLLGLTLEVEDCVESAYVLEVSSPGLNRLFFQPEQLARAIGAKVEAALVKPLPHFPGRKKYIGTVVKVEGDICTLSVTEPDNVCVDIPWAHIRKIRQIYVMPEKKLPGKSLKNTRQKKSAGKKKK